MYSTHSEWMEAVKRDGLAIRFSVQEEERSRFDCLARDIRAKPYDISMAAVHQNGLALQFIGSESQTELMCRHAVAQNGLALEFVEHQTLEICLTAVGQNGLALRFVEQQTPLLCLAAVRQNWFALRFVKLFHR